jgi:hypothetical protein
MTARKSRQIPGVGGYARRDSVGALTRVWGERSDSGVEVLMPAVVKSRILEGQK